jgi:hypothetical protein
MNDDSYLNEWGIKWAEAETSDLKKFWKDLSWWERDKSINSATSMINNLSLTHKSSSQEERIKSIRGELLNLWNSNSRPSKLRQFLHLEPDESWKPNFRMCLHLIMTTQSNEDLVALGKYLGFNDIEQLRNRRTDLYERYMWLGQNSTQAMYYAFRNYLGKSRK